MFLHCTKYDVRDNVFYLLLTVLLYAGSIYCDFTLRSNGFAGEGVRGSSVIAFKTHNSPGAGQIIRTRFYEAALYIIRSPWDVLVAEWNRKNSANSSKRNETKHSLSVGKEYFGKQLYVACLNLVLSKNFSRKLSTLIKIEVWHLSIEEYPIFVIW